MYVCEKCGRQWPPEDAEDNDFLCTRKCNGTLILKQTEPKPAGDLIDRLPFPAAYPWYMSLNTGLGPVKRVNNMIFTAYQAMRITGLLLLSDYLESDKSCLTMGRPLNGMRMPHWQDWKTLTDTLAKYITGGMKPKYPPPDSPVFGKLAEDWRAMGKAWAKEPGAARFAKGKSIPSPMDVFREIRNDRAHRLAVMTQTGDEPEILEKYMPVLEFALKHLFETNDINLVRLPPGQGEAFISALRDPLTHAVPVIPLRGIHSDFCFETEEYPLDEEIREALEKSPWPRCIRGGLYRFIPCFSPWTLKTRPVWAR